MVVNVVLVLDVLLLWMEYVIYVIVGRLLIIVFVLLFDMLWVLDKVLILVLILLSWVSCVGVEMNIVSSGCCLWVWVYLIICNLLDCLVYVIIVLWICFGVVIWDFIGKFKSEFGWVIFVL